MKRIAPAFALSLVAAPAFAQYDPGGSVSAYAALVDQFNQAGTPLAIRGQCISACTMKLGVKRVCIDPSATLYFHGATHDYGYGGEVLMESKYTRFPRLYRYVAPFLASPVLHAVSGRQAIAMGVPSCI